MMGDIILFYDQKNPLMKALSWTFQGMLARGRRTRTAYHVALMTGSHGVIHAVPNGVEQTLIYEIVDIERAFGIYRYKRLQEHFEKDPLNIAQFAIQMEECTCEAYNMNVAFLRSTRERLFCSELIAKVFLAAGFKLFADTAARTLPSTIENSIRERPDEWIDMTESYLEYLDRAPVARDISGKLRDDPVAAGALRHAKRFLFVCNHARHKFFGDSKPPIKRNEYEVTHVDGSTVIIPPTKEDWAKKMNMSKDEEFLFLNFVDWIEDGSETNQEMIRRIMEG